MLKFIDNAIENILKKSLHKKREKIIQKTIQLFKKNHPNVDPKDFIKKVQDEADRIYAIVDRSILRERIQRAKYAFWITAILGIIIAGVLGAFSSGATLPLTAPIIAAFIPWLISVGTIPVSYNQRVKGAMDSVMMSYEKFLLEQKPYTALSAAHEYKIETSLAQIQNLIQSKSEDQLSNIKTMLALSAEDQNELIYNSDASAATWPKNESKEYGGKAARPSV